MDKIKRKIAFAIFDPALASADDIGFIRYHCLVGVVIAATRKAAIAANPELKAVPLGQLTAKEKLWLRKQKDG